MKLMILLFVVISLSAVAKEPNDKTTANDTAVAPSADFIELTQAYENSPKVAPENNAFIYLVGLTAPEGTAPMDFGQ